MSAIRHTLSGSAVPIRGNDLDTDRIIPARFLKELTFDHMGNYFFYDERFDEQGSPKPHVLNDPRFKQGTLLVVGKNFGCGSSREHAPQAMMRYGIQAVIGESFAEIFAGNCKAIGVPAVTASAQDIETLLSLTEQDPSTVFKLDLEQQTITGSGITLTVHLPESRRVAFLTGTWDTRAVLSSHQELVRQTAARLPYITDFKIG